MSRDAASIRLLADPMYTAADIQGIRITSFAASALSIVGCLLAFFWLYRLKTRVFRHTLIFLLILFDFIRAIVLFWYPIRLWYAKEDAIGPHACQADGFFAALSIEASDFGVLVIAVHTLLFIMYPRTGSSSNYKYGGLYKYRKIVYIFWAAFAILFASLPFVTTSSVPNNPTASQNSASLGYIQNLTWCYLPVQPIWYRLVLAWIPRYLILIAICVIYVGVYMYVRKVLRAVDNVYTRRQESGLPDPVPPPPSPNQDQQPTDLEKHGVSDEPLPPNFDLAISPLDPYPVRNNSVPSASPSSSGTQSTGGDRNGVRAPEQGQFVTPRYLNNIEMETSTRDRQRAFIERQVRYLLLYPICYVIMWTAPFLSQCLMYSTYFLEHPVVWLGYLSTSMYAISGFLNTVIFAIIETPWRRERRQSETLNSTTDMEGLDEHEASDPNIGCFALWWRRKSSYNSASENFPCLRRLSETSAISIEKVKYRIGMVFGRPREKSTSSSNKSTPVDIEGPQNAPQLDQETRMSQNISESVPGYVNRENTENFKPVTNSDLGGAENSHPTAFPAQARLIRSPYDIMKVTAERPKHKSSQNASSEWWDRLDELEDEGTLRAFRKNHFVSDPRTEVGPRAPYQGQIRRMASVVLPDGQYDANPSLSDSGSNKSINNSSGACGNT
ncbi:G protein-coupled glucose receptor regulating Gpa2-domain-containing protein [Lipomyces kononenkoae]